MVKTLAFCLLSALAVPAALAQEAGRIDLIEGDVTITDARAQQRVPRLGEAVRQGDTVTTGRNGEMHLKMDDGGVLAVRPDARLTIVKYQNKGKDSDVTLFSLARGALRAITGWIGRRVPDRVSIQTPTATIGIRGTDHEALVIPAGSSQGEPGTYDKVNAGGTRISNARGVVDVSPGQAGFAAPGAAPAVLATIPAAFQAGRNDARLEGLHERLQRAPESRVSVPAKNQQQTQQQAGKGGNVQIQGNTRINATAKDTNAVAVGQDNEASNRIGTIGGR